MEKKEIRTEKTVRARFETTTRKSGAEVTTKQETEITFGMNTNFFQVNQFIADMKKIHAAAMKAMKNGDRFIFEITEGVYRWEGMKLETISFNAWEAAPTEEQSAEDGYIYFRPDTRYTAGHKDMILRRGHILEDLAEYIG